MVAITFIAADGAERIIDASAVASLMENAVGNGIDTIEAICGGNAYCGTCRVHVDPSWMPVMGDATEMELPMIEASGDIHPGVRLACQIIIGPEMEGLIVRTPASQN